MNGDAMWVCQTCLDINYSGYSPQDDFDTEHRICPMCPVAPTGRPQRVAPCFNTENLVPSATSEKNDADLTEAEKKAGRIVTGPSGLKPKPPVESNENKPTDLFTVPLPAVPYSKEEFDIWKETIEIKEAQSNMIQSGSNGWESTSETISFVPETLSYLYFETGRKSRIYQYPAPPSPGDLHRIQIGKLRVFHVKDGSFQEVDGSGKPFHVDKYEFLPKALLNDKTHTKREP